MKQIAEVLELAPSTVSRFVDSLINKKLLSRKLDGEDRRGTRIFPTAAAEKIHQQLEDTGKKLYTNMNKIMGKKAFTELVDDMRSIRQRL